MTNWKVEIRTNCKICNNPLPTRRHRTYCSPRCRNKEYGQRYKELRRKWAQDKRGEAPEVDGTKVQCPICDKWYVQLGTHAIQAHEYDTAREFKEDSGLDVKRGVVPEWYRELKGKQALSNGTWKNLSKGKKFWFKKGSKIAGRYKRSPQTLRRLRKQGKEMGQV